MAHVNPIQLQKFLKGVDYPASKGTLIENAKNLGADENVCATLEQLPDEEFQTPADISQAFGKLSDEAKRTSSSTGGNEFIAQAMQDSLAEIELSELALQKTANDEVKAFAQRMIDEHSRMGRDIEQLAGRKNIDLPTSLTQEQKSACSRMAGLSGQEFDRQFMAHNVKDHEKDVKVFTHYAQQESDAEIRALAKHGAQVLREHLAMAQDISKRL